MCRMLNKKVLNLLLNVKHTVVDDAKIFDDNSVVFYVHPTKGEQCRCGICGRKAPTMMPAGDTVCEEPQTLDFTKR